MPKSVIRVIIDEMKGRLILNHRHYRLQPTLYLPIKHTTPLPINPNPSQGGRGNNDQATGGLALQHRHGIPVESGQVRAQLGLVTALPVGVTGEIRQTP